MWLMELQDAGAPLWFVFDARDSEAAGAHGDGRTGGRRVQLAGAPDGLDRRAFAALTLPDAFRACETGEPVTVHVLIRTANQP